MGTPEFPNLGKHCSVEDCKLIDFLPFTCDRCNKVFCLQHRTYTKHHCPTADLKDVTVVVCPLCAKGVRLVPNEDPNITWEAHVNGDCDPSNYQRATTKKRCPSPGCREQLTFSNTIRCRDCNREHCLKHRFGPDHRCPGPKKPESGFTFPGLLRGQKGASTTGSNGSSWWGSSLMNAASSFKTSAAQAMKKARDDALVERFHENGGRANSGNGKVVTIDACPKCSKGFTDPVMLVEHVEREHGGTSAS